jgi:uncharacterized protein YidB (DUF937 family)
MSLLESLVSQVLGQQPPTTAAPSGISGVLMQMLGGQGATQRQEGGLAGLVDKFRAAGLGYVADSWIGTGANQPISPQQLETVFGHNQVQDMSRQAGMQSGDFLS